VERQQQGLSHGSRRRRRWGSVGGGRGSGGWRPHHGGGRCCGGWRPRHDGGWKPDNPSKGAEGAAVEGQGAAVELPSASSTWGKMLRRRLETRARRKVLRRSFHPRALWRAGLRLWAPMVFCFVRSLLASNFIFVYCDFCDGLDLSSSVLVSNLDGKSEGDGRLRGLQGTGPTTPACALRRPCVNCNASSWRTGGRVRAGSLFGVTRRCPCQRWAWSCCAV
jgi:hypothetical protein